MALVFKIDSNVTGLRYQEESSLGVANSNNPWSPAEPNSYDNFGGQISTVARNPINQGRQRQKGVTVDLDASGGWNTDVTFTNLQDLLQAYFFADLRRKADVGEDRQPRRAGVQGEYQDFLITDIDGATEEITVDSRVAVSAVVVVGGTGYAVGDVVEVTPVDATVNVRFIVTGEAAGVVTSVALTLDGFSGGNEGRANVGTGAGAATTAITGSGDNALTLTVTYDNGLTWQAGDLVFLENNNDLQNDGLKTVTAVSGNVVTVAEDLVTDATPAADARMTTVGFEAAAGDLDIDASSPLPKLTSTVLDFTTLGLIPGEQMHIGGDPVTTRFTSTDSDGNEVNNGFVRMKEILANEITLDKSQFTMVTENSAAETIQLFFGRVLKNEADPDLQVRRTYQIERTLGAPDDASPSDVQAEYLVGSVANQATFNFNTADKITADLTFVATDNEQIVSTDPLKGGDRPALVSEDAFNTSNDFARLKLAILDPVDSNPTALFAFLTQFTLVINNNATPNKAVSVLGAFEVTVGQFNVEGTAEAYFNQVEAVQAVRCNEDVTLDLTLVKSNRGLHFDVPLIALGDARLNVEQDQPILLPLEQPAAADRNFNHTLLAVFYDYLPDFANPEDDC